MDFILTKEGAVEESCLICALELVPWGTGRMNRSRDTGGREARLKADEVPLIRENGSLVKVDLRSIWEVGLRKLGA